MDLNMDFSFHKIGKNESAKQFIKELRTSLENRGNQYKNELKATNNETSLTNEEESKFHKAKMDFLQEYFQKELSNKEKGEIYIVTNKYENDYEYHRYKVAQYKNNKEYKYITFEKDLPENIKLNDVVRKINGKYIYDENATRYVENSINRIKQEIIDKREKR